MSQDEVDVDNIDIAACWSTMCILLRCCVVVCVLYYHIYSIVVHLNDRGHTTRWSFIQNGQLFVHHNHIHWMDDDCLFSVIVCDENEWSCFFHSLSLSTYYYYYFISCLLLRIPCAKWKDLISGVLNLSPKDSTNFMKYFPNRKQNVFIYTSTQYIYVYIYYILWSIECRRNATNAKTFHPKIIWIRNGVFYVFYLILRREFLFIYLHIFFALFCIQINLVLFWARKMPPCIPVPNMVCKLKL